LYGFYRFFTAKILKLGAVFETFGVKHPPQGVWRNHWS